MSSESITINVAATCVALAIMAFADPVRALGFKKPAGGCTAGGCKCCCKAWEYVQGKPWVGVAVALLAVAILTALTLAFYKRCGCCEAKPALVKKRK